VNCVLALCRRGGLRSLRIFREQPLKRWKSDRKFGEEIMSIKFGRPGNRIRHQSALFLGMVLFAIFALGSAAQGQEAGQILGIITDPTGAVVPNATIAAKNLGTNALRTVTSATSRAYI